MNKSIKIACAVIIFLFISGSIAVAEQTKLGNKTYAVATQIENLPLKNSNNSVDLLPGQIILPGGHIINVSDLEKNVIKRGIVNFTLPRTDSTKEHMNDLNNLSLYLKKQLNLTPDEAVSIGCKSDNCTYEVIKMNKTSSASLEPAYNDWVEDAIYWNWGGTSTYSGRWNVPSAPPDPESQTIFYFIDLENTYATSILQPVLAWNWDYTHQWEIESVGDAGGWYWGPHYPANVGDLIEGSVWHDFSTNYWDIDTYDYTTGYDSYLIIPTSATDYIRNHATLEVYSVNTCAQFPGYADFNHLQIDSVTPSWGIDQKQTGCGLGVNIVSSSEVQLKVGPFDDVALFQSNGLWALKYDFNSATNSTADKSIAFGNGTAQPVVGDFRNTGIPNDVAIYQSNGWWALKYNFNSATNGTADKWIPFGNGNGKPIVGDFDHDGFADDVAILQSNGWWALKYNFNSATNGTADKWIAFGDGTAKPVVGDFDHDGFADDVAIFQSNGWWAIKYNFNSATNGTADKWIPFGNGTAKPVVGDFNGDGLADDVAILQSNGWWALKYNFNSATNGTADKWIAFGDGTAKPVVGEFNNN